jgi:alpha-tubulin suppressor-like RCC1 family protein
MRICIAALLVVAAPGCSILNDDFSFEPADMDAGLDGGAPPDSSLSDAGADASPCGMICSGLEPYCDLDGGRCVECLDSADCDDGDPCTVEQCSGGACSSSPGEQCVVAVAAGRSHSCALRRNGVVLCWGSNDFGQLGDGTMTGRPDPQPVTGLTDAIALSLGAEHSCALRAGGPVSCWGRNNYGQLGDATMVDRLVPTPVSSLSDGIALDAGSSYTCAIRSMAGGTIACWGGNFNGELGDGTTTNSAVPVAVSGFVNVVEVSSGFGHACGRLASGGVFCFGLNSRGQFGDGTTDVHSGPVFSGFDSAAEVSAGGRHTCARQASMLLCAGYNNNGQIGDGTMTDALDPTTVTGITDAAEISAGYQHTCARRDTGQVVCWGANVSGQLGDGTMMDRASPVSVVDLDTAIQITTGDNHTCARRTTSDGVEVVCWGLNASGQLGDGTMTTRAEPARVIAL